MGQKVHPGGLRVGVIHDWKSNWYTDEGIRGPLLEDVKIREHIQGKLSHAGLSDILIRKDKQRITIDIYTARPGIVIGKSGAEVDALRNEVHAHDPEERPHQHQRDQAPRARRQARRPVDRRAAREPRQLPARDEALARLRDPLGRRRREDHCGGRLGGAEMSRSEHYWEGRVPLHTIRADIDYGFAEAKTTTGRIGVKVWINKGEIMPEGYEGSGGRDAPRRPGSGAPPGRRREGLGASREGGRGRARTARGSARCAAAGAAGGGGAGRVARRRPRRPRRRPRRPATQRRWRRGRARVVADGRARRPWPQAPETPAAETRRPPADAPPPRRQPRRARDRRRSRRKRATR